MAQDVDPIVTVSRLLPQANVDNSLTNRYRVGRYKDQYVQSLVPTKHLLADEGSYFVTTNPTPATGIALNAAVTAFSDTNALFVIQNTENPSNAIAKRVYLDRLRLMLTATTTATVSMEFVMKRSQISREATTAANRTVYVPVNMASGSGRTSVARVTGYNAAGAHTIPASSVSDPVVSRCRIPTGLGVVGDEYVLKFGGEDESSKPGSTAVRATDPARITTQAPPVIIEPGEWLVIHSWWLTAAAAVTFEFELSHWER